MMKCRKINKLLAADYLDGELHKDARAEVMRHLEACPRCREFEAAIRRAAVEPLRKAMPVSAPPGLHQRVMRRIRQEQVLGKARLSGPGWHILVHIPKTIYAASSLATVILIAAFLVYYPLATREGGSPSGETDALYGYLLEEASSFSNGNGNESEGGSQNSSDYGTLVEEFLM